MSDNENKSTAGIDEDTIRFFVWSVWNFFQSSTGVEPEVGTPYLFDSFDHDDYTGIIGVSGSQKGSVYITMEKRLLDDAMIIPYPHLDDEEGGGITREELRIDYAGEMANIISGNVRNYLGEQFLISVPVVVTAPGSDVHLTSGVKGIIFPVKWNNSTCHMILCLEKNESKNSEDTLSEIENAI